MKCWHCSKDYHCLDIQQWHRWWLVLLRSRPETSEWRLLIPLSSIWVSCSEVDLFLRMNLRQMTFSTHSLDFIEEVPRNSREASGCCYLRLWMLLFLAHWWLFSWFQEIVVQYLWILLRRKIVGNTKARNTTDLTRRLNLFKAYVAFRYCTLADRFRKCIWKQKRFSSTVTHLFEQPPKRIN